MHQRVLPKMYLSILGKISKADLLTILLLFFNFDGGFWTQMSDVMVPIPARF